MDILIEIALALLAYAGCAYIFYHIGKGTWKKEEHYPTDSAPKMYGVAYQYKGRPFNIVLPAESPQDAEERVRALTHTGKVIGEFELEPDEDAVDDFMGLLDGQDTFLDTCKTFINQEK